MFIYIDESGSFTPTDLVNSWNVVGALVVPETSRRRLERLLLQLKLSNGRKYSDELKLRHLDEATFRQFITDVGRTECLLFISAIDLGSQDKNLALRHQEAQVAGIEQNRSAMIYEEGRAIIDDLARRVAKLSLPLYIQFVTQIDLLEQVYRYATLYFSQRIPATLSRFRWVSDEKNSEHPMFEEIVRYMAPALLQAKSLSDPSIFVEGFDYSHFRHYSYEPDEIPSYIEEQTGKPIKSATNIGKVLSDFRFVRSHDVPCVQVIDLLVSGFRRVMRNEFDNSLGLADILGAMTVQAAKPSLPIHLISLCEEQFARGHASEVARRAARSCKQMLKR